MSELNDEDAFIGVAWMEPDGTIKLQLRAVGPNITGTGMVAYTKEQPEYESVLAHIGGLTPGERKSVRPWAN